MIIDKKNTGSYYTPEYLSCFISERVLSHFEEYEHLSILEPSVGDGSFISELSKNNVNINLTALDINKNELSLAKEKWSGEKSKFIQTDYLEYSSTKKFSVIVGNPPYIKKGRLNENQIEISKSIHKNEGLSEVSVKNIWTTFLIKACTELLSNGVIAFVLPSELLQVKFAKEVRDYLKNKFERIEIFTFNNLMFECKGQDTIVLFAYKKHKKKGEYFVNISSKEQLQKNNFALKQNNLLVNSEVKWTHHFLSNREINFLNNLKSKIKTVGYFCDSKPGIVTAANKFFILNKETEEQYKLNEYTRPIIQKGLFVNGSVVFRKEDYEKL